MTKHSQDNRANQLNPDHDAYWQSRGYEGKPNESQDQNESDTARVPRDQPKKK